MGVPFKYKLILPSGSVFVFEQPQWDIDFHFPDGFGLPPITHQTQDIYQQPGSSLKGIKISPRVIALTVQLKVTDKDRSTMHEIRRTLWKTLLWNSTLATAPPDYLILRYENNNIAADLHCYYLSDTFVGDADTELVQNFSIQLIAYDPFWYRVQSSAVSAAASIAPELRTASLAIRGELTMNYIVAKIGRVWTNMGLGTNNAIFDIQLAPNGDIYVTGDFTNICGVAANRIARWNGVNWSPLGSGCDDRVRAVLIAPDGTVYAIGRFLNAGGGAANRIAKWDGAAWSALGTGLNGEGTCLAMDNGGNIWAGGSFTSAGGAANTQNIAMWNGSAWSGNSSAAALIYAIAVAPSGDVYASGDFASINGVSASGIARWNGSVWSPLGTGLAGLGFSGRALHFARNGDLYVGGDFATAGGIASPNAARWNGTTWSGLGGGLGGFGSVVEAIEEDIDGSILYGGAFVTALGVSLFDGLARWNGTSWSMPDIDFPGAGYVQAILIPLSGDMYLGTFTNTGTAIISSFTSLIPMRGDTDSYPIMKFSGKGFLEWIENFDTGKIIALNLLLAAGEVVTLDLTPGIKTFTSNVRGNLLPYSSVLPISDFGSWALAPFPIATAGGNKVMVKMSSTDPTEFNDGSNQLSGYANITGITPFSTDDDNSGRLHVVIVSEGAGNYHVDLYNVVGGVLTKVGHTASYNAGGAKAVLPDNASGLGGTITVDALVAADSDIVVYFAVGEIIYKEPYLTTDAAVKV